MYVWSDVDVDALQIKMIGNEDERTVNRAEPVGTPQLPQIAEIKANHLQICMWTLCLLFI